MKSILLKTFLVVNLFFIYNCKAQTANDYITFYDDVVPKLSSIVSNKTQFYGQNFSIFHNELLSKQINIVSLGYGTKTDPGTKYYVLRLFFEDDDLWSIATDNSYQYPWVSITFQDEIPVQIKNMVLQNHGEWSNTFVQYFANMKIEKIEFVGMNGYNSTDNSLK
ncbi:hypothetical protein [Chryseobacterium wangxinyae]|uniref:hypothetical protein n=1 Tax=Chryseobacterium sp. CY353 TaxID=2997334 RepID=UPI00226D8983|nr:hypothetical protein [Chryseobacterium sp. CY353]MCY0969534.1 hypothetical protein [Chryseobacterium sp. CY353]